MKSNMNFSETWIRSIFDQFNGPNSSFFLSFECSGEKRERERGKVSKVRELNSSVPKTTNEKRN
jgi:hypothetical protein